MEPLAAIGGLLYALGPLITVLAAIFLIASVDDLLLDAAFWTDRVRRVMRGQGWVDSIDEAELTRRPERRLAVMVPAWDESAVIEPMLRNLLAGVRYERFSLFVGVYPNDAATRAAVARVCADDPRVIEVLNPAPGPTCKADCLNVIWEGILAEEARSGHRFEIIAMQDCEDVVHPLAWRLINALVPAYDMVQLPVLSLPRSWWQWTAAHYQDEFAQLHFKDLVARRLVARSVPAAGVGVAFSRRALEAVAARGNGSPFETRSLTEDYDIALQLQRLGMRQVFAQVRIRPGGHAQGAGTTPSRSGLGISADLIGVREYFPERLRPAVRQKARWVVGIALQAWRAWGWQGDFWWRLMFWRDRKVLLTNPAAALGYMVALVLIAQWLWPFLDPDAPIFPPVVEPASITAWLVSVNVVLLTLRLIQRIACVGLVHGPLEGLLSAPRMAWASLINALATARALLLWLRHLATGRVIGWDKTAHQYPDQLRWGTLNGAPSDPPRSQT
jgi:adsorption protein B